MTKDSSKNSENLCSLVLSELNKKFEFNPELKVSDPKAGYSFFTMLYYTSKKEEIKKRTTIILTQKQNETYKKIGKITCDYLVELEFGKYSYNLNLKINGAILENSEKIKYNYSKKIKDLENIEISL
jgi:hypothetical protein